MKRALVLSEKVIDADPAMDGLLVDLHHEHKRRNDYSALEISRKRALSLTHRRVFSNFGLNRKERKDRCN